MAGAGWHSKLLNQLEEGEAVALTPRLGCVPQSGVVIVFQVLGVKSEGDYIKAIWNPMGSICWEVVLNTNLNINGVSGLDKASGHRFRRGVE